MTPYVIFLSAGIISALVFFLVKLDEGIADLLNPIILTAILSGAISSMLTIYLLASVFKNRLWSTPLISALTGFFVCIVSHILVGFVFSLIYVLLISLADMNFAFAGDINGAIAFSLGTNFVGLLAIPITAPLFVAAGLVAWRLSKAGNINVT